MTTLGTVQNNVFAGLLDGGVDREELAREMINVARQCWPSLYLVPQLREDEAGELHIDVVLWPENARDKAFDEALTELNAQELLDKVGYKPPNDTPHQCA